MGFSRNLQGRRGRGRGVARRTHRMTDLEAATEILKCQESQRIAPRYRFPAIEESTAEFQLNLPPFQDAPEGFSGSLDELLRSLRSEVFSLENLPLAPVVDQYLAFRERL